MDGSVHHGLIRKLIDLSRFVFLSRVSAWGARVLYKVHALCLCRCREPRKSSSSTNVTPVRRDTCTRKFTQSPHNIVTSQSLCDRKSRKNTRVIRGSQVAGTCMLKPDGTGPVAGTAGLFIFSSRFTGARLVARIQKPNNPTEILPQRRLPDDDRYLVQRVVARRLLSLRSLHQCDSEVRARSTSKACQAARMQTTQQGKRKLADEYHS